MVKVHSRRYWIIAAGVSWAIADVASYFVISILAKFSIFQSMHSSVTPLLFMIVVQPMLFMYYRQLVKEKLEEQKYF